jgi:hypothetical protein
MAGGTISPPIMRAAFSMVVPSGTSAVMPSMVILAISRNKFFCPILRCRKSRIKPFLIQFFGENHSKDF